VTLRYAVTGDHSRMVYSRHRTEAAALAAAQGLARKWGYSHPGSEPRVVDIETRRTLYEVIGWNGKITEIRVAGTREPTGV